MIDLHMHTYYSDGQYSPKEIIESAARRGIRTLAITDHDNLRGFMEAEPIARAEGVALIPAVEFTTRWPGANLPAGDANVDVLGYFVDPNDAAFQAYTRAALNDIHERIENCCIRLTAAGHLISMIEVFAENPRYAGGIQLIHAILHKGLAADFKEAMRLMDTVWLTGRDTPFTIRATIEQIHLAGGTAVLAHPVIVRPEGELLTAKWLRELVDAGLDGIEIYHYRLDSAALEYFLGLAREFNLLVSGGSDFHGWGRGFEDIGREPVTMEMVEALRAKQGIAKGVNQ